MAMPASEQCLAAFCVLLALGTSEAAAQANCAAMRSIDIGISVAPPNVVHTSPYVALELGYFAKHCIDAHIVQFDGGESPAARAAAAQGTALVSTNAAEVGRGVRVKQIWGLAPRLPQAYVVAESIKTAADLKGKRLSATGGGIGGLNWLLSREVLKAAGLTTNDAQFIPSATAARLPALIAGQIDGVALHPVPADEDVHARVAHHVADREERCDVRRGQDQTERPARRVGRGPRDLPLPPLGLPTHLDGREVEPGRHRFARHVALPPKLPRTTGATIASSASENAPITPSALQAPEPLSSTYRASGVPLTNRPGMLTANSQNAPV